MKKPKSVSTVVSNADMRLFFEKIFGVLSDDYRRVQFDIEDKSGFRYRATAYQLGSGTNKNLMRIDVKKMLKF